MLLAASTAFADTYKCKRDGQTYYSDSPCSTSSTKVDATTDRVDREQQRQAEGVHLRNRVQLTDIEREAQYGRYSRKPAIAIDR